MLKGGLCNHGLPTLENMMWSRSINGTALALQEGIPQLLLPGPVGSDDLFTFLNFNTRAPAKNAHWRNAGVPPVAEAARVCS